MYESKKLYSADALESLLAGLDAYEAATKPILADAGFVSNLASYTELPKPRSLVVPYSICYRLHLVDVVFRDNILTDAIHFASNSKNTVRLYFPVSPNIFWKEYIDVESMKINLVSDLRQRNVKFNISIKHTDPIIKRDELIACMSNNGFSVCENLTTDDCIIFMLEEAIEVDESLTLLSSYIDNEDSFKQSVIGDFLIILDCEKWYTCKGNQVKEYLEEDESFFEDFFKFLDPSSKPNLFEYHGLDIIYSTAAYYTKDWDLSESILSTEPITQPIGKYLNNDRRDHYLISKIAEQGGYRLIIEHCKFADAELPEPFKASDFQLHG